MKRWLITGCSSGIGREIAAEVLRRGDQVLLTARRPETVADLVAEYPDTARSAALDVNDPEQVRQSVETATQEFGGVDVLVNNAGYGYLSAVEEGVDDEVRRLFDTNFFGAVAMIKETLPQMRERRDGLIINISSMTGLVTNPPNTYYSCTKHAMEALTAGLAKEVKPFGIKACAVEPGAVHTDWAARSMQATSRPMEAYADTVGKMRERLGSASIRLRGDARKVAERIVDLADLDEPPAHLLLGNDVLGAVRTHLTTMGELVEQWADVSSSIDRDDAPQ